MKHALKFIAFAVVVALSFPVLSCFGDTPAPASIEVEYAGTASVEQEEAQSVVDETADEITRFPPLADNERFAFSEHSVQLSPVIWQPHITIYAVNDNNIENAVELFTWAISRNNIQFTSDFRTAFLHVGRYAIPGRVTSFDIYMADGNTGEIRRLLTDIRGNFRASKDGRFILFQIHRGWEFAHLFLFDAKSETIVGEFEWWPENHIPGGDFSQSSWAIRRFDNVFRIYALGEHGYIDAVAELNPATLELKMLWNDFREAGFSRPPNLSHDEGWADDVGIQHANPNIMLRR
jgi:hypothetical protein